MKNFGLSLYANCDIGLSSEGKSHGCLSLQAMERNRWRLGLVVLTCLFIASGARGKTCVLMFIAAFWALVDRF